MYTAMRKLYFIFFLVTAFTKNTRAQSFAINTDGSTANGSALLDVKSTAKGLLIPRMSKTERNGIITPATGLLVFQNAPDSIGFYYYDGSKWNWMAAINGNADTLAWKRNGNSGTNATVNFIGTTDDKPFNIRVNNQKAGSINNSYRNTFFGYRAGDVDNGNNNCGFGFNALLSNTDGIDNVAIGSETLRLNTTGNQNIAIGFQSLRANTIGNSNIGIGRWALTNNISGAENIAIGRSALESNTTGNRNIAFSYAALVANTSGSDNIANGYRTLFFNTTGESNMASGYQALFYNETGNNNIANGYEALKGNTTGSNNIANGYKALNINNTGNNNFASGYEALITSQAVDNNIAIGYQAIRGNLFGSNNIALGYRSLYENNSGDYNIAGGHSALYSNYVGNNNIALGRRALEFNTQGNNNIAIGARALEATTNTDYNTAIGAFALQTPSTGFHNTAIGYSSDVTLVSANNATALGYNATAPASNYVRVGNTAVTAIVGNVAFSPSDGRFKTNVQTTVPGLDFIMGLRPVTYHFEKAKYSRFIGEKQDENYVLKLQKQDAENKTSTGFIAQEVEQLAKNLNYDFDGLYKPQNDKDAYGLGYQQFVTPLIKAVQEQQVIITEQQDELKQLKTLVQKLETRLANLENK
jgi:trimeric autotransporter adhesin